MKILIRRVDNLGDVVMIIPVIAALRKNFPGSHITAMVKSQHRDVLNGYADEFIRPKRLKIVSGFDKIINIEYQIPTEYKTGNIFKDKLISLGVTNFRKKKHVSRQIFDHLKAHHISGKFSAPVIHVDEKQKLKAIAWFRKRSVSIKNDFIITLDPGSNFSKKCWPVGYYVALCAWLINSFNAKIILTGASEDDKIKLIKEKLNSPNIISLTGKKLKFVTAVISNSDLHIGNDSGLGHVAAAVNKPTITIFGPTSPVLWKPYGNRSITVFKPYSNCKGGYGHAMTCELQKCLISIKPNDVADAVLAAMNKFIRSRSPQKFDLVSLSPHLKWRRSKGNILLKNEITGHRCLIEEGWENINPVLEYLSKSRSLLRTQKKFKESKPLLDFFFAHRFIVPPGVVQTGAYL